MSEHRLKKPDVRLDEMWPRLLDSLTQQGFIRSARIRTIFEAQPRHLFVDQTDDVLRRLAASENSALDIGHGQSISQPEMVVKTTALLDPKPGEQCLDVGVGSGWQAAILKECVGIRGRVVAIERVAALASATQRRLMELGLDIEVILGDATNRNDLPEGPFDIITCAAGCDTEPDFWKDRLANGGRIVVPKKAGEVRDEVFYLSNGDSFAAKDQQDGPVQQLVRITRVGDTFTEEAHGYCRYVPLVAGEIQR